MAMDADAVADMALNEVNQEDMTAEPEPAKPEPASRPAPKERKPYVALILKADAIKAVKKKMKSLRNDIHDRGECLRICTENGWALEYAPPMFRFDPLVVRSALVNYGLALEFASADLKANPKLVDIAIRQNAMAIMYADETIRDDKEMMLKAVKKYGPALEFASEDLKRDPDVALAAAANDPRSMLAASKGLKNQKYWLMAVGDERKEGIGWVQSKMRSHPDVTYAAYGRDAVQMNFPKSRSLTNLRPKHGLRYGEPPPPVRKAVWDR